MKVVVDVQGAQATNARRGIGGYVRSLVTHLFDGAPDDEWSLVASGAFGDELDELTDLVGGRPNVTLHVFEPPDLLRGAIVDDPWLRTAAEVVYEEFVASLHPDVVLVTSLFEGSVDRAVVSFRSFVDVPVAVVLYDLIPLVRRDTYLADPRMERWYEGRLGQLRRADHLLAISGASRQEAVDRLDVEPDAVTDIAAAVDDVFRPGDVDARTAASVRRRFGIERPYVLYTGGIDPRKNIDGLIDGFAAMAPDVRDAHQLVVVCSVDDAARSALEARASAAGLRPGDLCLTGFVSSDDLVALCRLATVAAFPSLHEGFGLPALEAMSCGRAVIASDRSSLPEVVGRDDALFDPTSSASIAALLERVLTDDEFRHELEQHALVQAGRFSWERTATATLDVLRRLVAVGRPASRSDRPTLAVVSPLPPEASGIADYTAMLLPHLARWYDVDVVTDLPASADPWVAANCRHRSVDWFRRHGHTYDRVVYQFGNSAFHGHMFDLLPEIPGVVVLHDFALSGIVSYRDGMKQSTRPWAADLYHSHGYPALVTDRDASDRTDMVWAYPVSLQVMQQATGVIVHSRHACELADAWYGAGASEGWQVVPMPRDTSKLPDRAAARATLALDDDDLLVCAFGIIGPTKLNDRLVEAWAASSLRARGRLVLVGESHDPAFGVALEQAITDQHLDEVTITGRVDARGYATHLAAADVAVQLRTRSRGETSASAFDCLAAGVATIVNANGSFAELPDDTVVRLADEFTVAQLVTALESLADDAARRHELGERGRRHVHEHHRAAVSAAAVRDAVEGFARRPVNRRPGLGDHIARRAGAPTDSAVRHSLARSATRSLRVHPHPRHLFVDVSELAVRDAGSGIQRVTRNLVRSLLLRPPDGVRVEPVAATATSSYHLARRFTADLLDVDLPLADEEIDPAPGDVYLGLDLQPVVVPAHHDTLRWFRRHGVRTAYVVYDLLPILMPECFFPGATETYSRWLGTVREADALVSISRSVRDELAAWLAANPAPAPSPALGWFHLGADLDGVEPRDDQLDLSHRPRFLMVGTLEPRKRHEQVLDAFELLWADGVDVELVIAGRNGWMVEALIERLHKHAEAGGRLQWLPGLSDEELATWYRTSSALIAASSGEGFGLPLIEAAHFGLPIIARDIPVFREVVGEHASWFSGDTGADLAQHLRTWLLSREEHRVPTPDGMAWNTWTESAAQLSAELQLLVDGTADGPDVSRGR